MALVALVDEAEGPERNDVAVAVLDVVLGCIALLDVFDLALRLAFGSLLSNVHVCKCNEMTAHFLRSFDAGLSERAFRKDYQFVLWKGKQASAMAKRVYDVRVGWLRAPFAFTEDGCPVFGKGYDVYISLLAKLAVGAPPRSDIHD